MGEKQAIDVVMLAWPNHPKRIEYFDAAVASLHEHLTATGFSVDFHCSSESERDPARDWYGCELSALCTVAGINLDYRDGNADLGANMNAALRMGDAPWELLVQDDFALIEPLDISEGIAFLDSHPGFAAVRYHYGLNTTKFTGDVDGFRVVDINGPWPFSDSCQLRRRTFASAYGEYAESTEKRPVVHGGSESDMCSRLRASGANIAASPRPMFKHIGKTRAEYRDHRPSRRDDSK